MITVARIGRQAAWLLGGRVASQGLAVLLSVVLAGRLGVAGLGQYAFMVAVVYLANVVTTFGTDMVLVRDIAAHDRPDGWAAALAVQLGFSVGAIGLIWLAAPAIPGQGTEVAAALRVFSLSLVPAAVLSVSSAGLRGAGRMGRLAALGVAMTALQLAGVWALVRPGTGLVAAATVLLAAQCGAAAASWAIGAASLAAFRSAPAVGLDQIARMVRSSAPIGVLGLLGVLYQRVGVIALSTFVGPTATGWFAAASRLVEGSKAGHVALFGALYPAMAEAHGTRGDRDGRASGRALGRSLWLSVGLAGVVSAGLLALGPVAVTLLYGPAFAPSSAAVAILALSVLPSTLGTYLSLELVAAHREDLTLRALLLSLAFLVALLALLIPALGWIGACWAVLGAETVQAVAMATARRDMAEDRPPRGHAALARESLADGAR